MNTTVITIGGLIIGGYAFNVILFFHLLKDNLYDVPDEFMMKIISEKKRRNLWLMSFAIPFLPAIYLLMYFFILLILCILFSPFEMIRKIIKEIKKENIE